MSKLERYLKLKKISKSQAARELGISRQYVYMLADGYPAGKKTAMRVAQWSEGFIQATEIMGMDRAGEK